VRFLVSNGADAGAKTDKKYTPLHYAAREGYLDIVKFLLEEAGADVNARCNGNNTPLDCAVYGNHANVEQYLLDKGGVLGPFRIAIKEGREVKLPEGLVTSVDGVR
jgi:ankyrin repeat protein